MGKLIDGVIAKIDRANEHIHALEHEIGMFVKGNPCSNFLSGEYQKNGTEYVFVVNTDPPVVPLRFSLIAGDVIHNLRSSLDHLIWALVLQNNRTPTVNNQFPICDTVGKFENAIKKGRIKGISSSAQAIVRSAQPFTTKAPKDEISYMLNKYDNIDKHRLLIVTATATGIGETITIVDNPDFKGVGADRSIVIPERDELIHGVRIREAGDKVFTISLQPPFQIKFEVDFVLRVCFDNDGDARNLPMIETLKAMSAIVQNIVRAFHGEFSS